MSSREAAVPHAAGVAGALTDTDPRRLASYEVTGRLGEGGQGVVYLGRGPAGPVAIKLLHALADEAAHARFIREVEVTKRVARFCTAQVLDVGMAGDRPFIVSEYVPGPSLQHQVRSEGPRRGSALDRLAINTVTALAAIHGAGVVHRDFKPGNVLMGPDGPVVIDFGISRALDGSVTSTVSQVVGTPAFMAPEQLAEGPIGPPTDLFAWAITMVYAATGEPAFGHQSIPKVINRILHEEPRLGALDGRLRELVAACLTKDPSRRPTARNLMDALMGQSGMATAEVPSTPLPGTGPLGPSQPGAPMRPGAASGPPAGSTGPATMRLPTPSGSGGASGPPVSPPGSPPRRKASPALIIAAVAAGLVVLVAGIGALAATTNRGKERQAVAPPSPSVQAHRPARHHTPSPSRTPSRRPATVKAAKVNPYTPQRLCGSGYRVIDRHGLSSATAYLLYNARSGANCVVTMVPRSTGRTPLAASLVVQGGGRESRSGAFTFYAGPVRLPARGKCVMWGGASKTARWTSGWTHCGS